MTEPAAIAPQRPATKPGRYVLVDALRGVAAVMVLLHHLPHSTVLDVALAPVLPRWFTATCDVGNQGVEIFFVISGFVIAHSLGRVTPDWAGAGSFIVRRQLRLDPPYLVVLALTLVQLAVENRTPGLVAKPFPTAREVGLNVVYLQNIFHTPLIVGVAWTLCLEVQFYLLFVAVTSLGYAASKAGANPSRVAVWLVWASGLACLAAFRQQEVLAPWFWSFWPYFALGVLCHWATHGLARQWQFAAYVAGFAGVAGYAKAVDRPALGLVSPHGTFMAVGLGTAALLYVAARLGTLRTWGRNCVLQYLGRISYSLYLVHMLVVYPVLRGGYKLTHNNGPAAIGWLVLATLLSVAAAELFYRLVERPSIRLSEQFKRRSGRVPVAASGVPVIPIDVPAAP